MFSVKGVGEYPQRFTQLAQIHNCRSRRSWQISTLTKIFSAKGGEGHWMTIPKFWPKPRLFFRYQIFRNRNQNPQKIGKSFETEKFLNRNVNLCPAVYPALTRQCGKVKVLSYVKPWQIGIKSIFVRWTRVLIDTTETSPKIGPRRCARFFFVILCNTLLYSVILCYST